MLEGQAIYRKIQGLSDEFHQHARNKQWSFAKRCYDKAVTVAVFLEFEEEKMHEIFGERAEHGVIVSEGMFPERILHKVIHEYTIMEQQKRR